MKVWAIVWEDKPRDPKYWENNLDGGLEFFVSRRCAQDWKRRNCFASNGDTIVSFEIPTPAQALKQAKVRKK